MEVRNPELLEKDYFACLRRHRIAHVYNAWARMPDLRHQMAIPDSATTDFRVCRALLRRGRPYEEAVKQFAPYTEVQDPNPEARESMRVLIGRAREDRQMRGRYLRKKMVLQVKEHVERDDAADRVAGRARRRGRVVAVMVHRPDGKERRQALADRHR